MKSGNFLTAPDRQALLKLARDGMAEHRVARRANALILLDRGMSAADVARGLLLDDDTIRKWREVFEQTGITQMELVTTRQPISVPPARA